MVCKVCGEEITKAIWDKETNSWTYYPCKHTKTKTKAELLMELVRDYPFFGCVAIRSHLLSDSLTPGDILGIPFKSKDELLSRIAEIAVDRILKNLDETSTSLRHEVARMNV